MEIKTSDLWLSAFALSKGCILTKIVKENDRTVVFYLQDPHCRDLENEFVTGLGVVSITSLKASMTHIKDVMFSKLRERSEIQSYR